MFVLKNTLQKKDHYACVRDMMSQTYTPHMPVQVL